MIITELTVNGDCQEQIQYPVYSFPHATFYTNLANYRAGKISWHWHPEIEFVWMLSGTLEFISENCSYHVSPGEGIFINSNVLHMIRPVSGASPTCLTHIFDAKHLIGGYNPLLTEKYINLILENKHITLIKLQSRYATQKKILDSIRKAYDFAEEKPFGYELLIRSALSFAWILLCQELQNNDAFPRFPASKNSERLKTMLQYIQQNHSHKIKLDDIAASAHISKRECLRCFQKIMRTTPFSYLQEYRMARARKLLETTEHSITEISYETGFSCSSYFGKIFKEIHGMTPVKYRNKYKSK